MLALLAAAWLACSSGPPPLTPPPPAASARLDMDLGSGGAPVTRLLDQLASARLALPANNIPGGKAEAAGTFRLDHGWEQAGGRAARSKRLWKHKLPVAFSQKRYPDQPPGTSLLVGDQALPFQMGTFKSPILQNGWDIYDDTLYLATTTDPAEWPEPPVLVHAPSKQHESRMNLELSGLPPAEFARLQVEREGLTRDCLLLPAPGTATFDVQVPEDASLRFGWALAPPADLHAEAEARFSVLVGDEEVWTGDAQIGSGWHDARVTLARWAGQTVELTFRTEPGNSPDWDYGVFASPEVVGKTTIEGPRRIVVVGIDTLRQDHLGTHGYQRATSPGMDMLASQSFVFDRAWSPAPRTRPSFRTSTTGRWPLDAITAPTFGEVLRSAGFSTGGAVANVHLAPRMGFADGFDWYNYDNSARAETQVDRALAWLTDHQGQDSFFFLHLMDPHTFYLAPPPFTDMFTEGLDGTGVPNRFNRWMILRQDQHGQLSKSNKEFLEARYDGEIAYMDRHVLRLVSEVEHLPGRTLFVIHSDHGEEFWEHGSYEHNHSLYEELVRTVLWIRPPGGLANGPHRVDTPVSIADIAPTLYDLAGVAQPPQMDGQSLLPLLTLDRPEASARETFEARPLPVGHLMFDTERWAVIFRGHKYILQTMSGREELYDLEADPGEKNDLARSTPDLAPYRQALAEATGYPVGQGWRIDVTDLEVPLELSFAEPVLAAGVIDPQAGESRRANLEWGEIPDLLPQDIATAELSEEGTRVLFTPGRSGKGTLYVLGPGPQTIATATVTGTTFAVPAGTQRTKAGPISVRPGILVLPTDSEAAHLAQDADSDSIEALKALGYLE